MHLIVQEHNVRIYGENDYIFTARSPEKSVAPVRDAFDCLAMHALLFRCTEIISLLNTCFLSLLAFTAQREDTSTSDAGCTDTTVFKTFGETLEAIQNVTVLFRQHYFSVFFGFFRCSPVLFHP